MTRGYKSPPLPGLENPRSAAYALNAYLQSLETRHYSPETIATRALCLRYLLIWCDERGIDTVGEISKPILERYQRYLFLYRTNKGKPLSLGTQAGRLSSIVNFFCWLTKHNYIPADPASGLDRPRGATRLPGQAMTVDEAEAVLSQPDCATLMGFRDRSILEVLYATAIRRSEVCKLTLGDIDWGRDALWVRQGKGKKDRVVPLGERARTWIEVYRDHVRPQLACGAGNDWLFLGRHGQPLAPKKITGWIGTYIKASKIAKTGSCHLLRHTAATLMLEGGADIRYIQALLGHSNLGTTEIYTHVSIAQLQAIHAQTHPGAKKILDKEALKALISQNVYA